MDEFEQSDLEKETNDSNNTCYLNATLYKEKNAFIKNCQCLFPLSLSRGGHKGLTEFMTMQF